jgi:hypothetical protein
LGNAALYPLLREQIPATTVFALAWIGVIFAQIGLGGIWLALGRPGALVRIVLAGGALLILVSSYLAGFLWRESYDGRPSSFQQQLEIVPLIPLVASTAAIPLWILRMFFGWEIRRMTSVPVPAPPPRQYSIGGLLVLTSLIASLLAAALQAQRFMRMESLEFWLAVGACCLGTLVISAVTLIPSAISVSHPFKGLGLLMGVAAILGVCLALFVLIALQSLGGSLRREEIYWTLGGVTALLNGFVLTLGVSLYAVRSCGYRLMMGRNSKANDDN